MTDKYYLKKALDIMYKRQRFILNDLDKINPENVCEDSEAGRINQAVDKARRQFLIQQEQYTDLDIKELIGEE